MATKITNKRPDKIKVNILGSEWTIEWRTKEEDPHLVECDGYCDYTIKTMVICWTDWDGMNYNNMAVYTAKVVRHEMVHAMLFESGLDSNTNKDWARNEEMVDWIAYQLPKLSDTIIPVSNQVCETLGKDLTEVK